MENPLAATLQWFDAQSEEVQKTVALLLGCLIYSQPRDSPEGVKRIREWLAPKSNPLMEVGTAVHFRALFDFQMRSWTTPEGRAQTLKRMESVREQALLERPDSIARIDASISDRPRLNALWAEVSRSWDHLCAGPLSNEALDLYAVSALVTRASKTKSHG